MIQPARTELPRVDFAPPAGRAAVGGHVQYLGRPGPANRSCWENSYPDRVSPECVNLREISLKSAGTPVCPHLGPRVSGWIVIHQAQPGNPGSQLHERVRRQSSSVLLAPRRAARAAGTGHSLAGTLSVDPSCRNLPAGGRTGPAAGDLSPLGSEPWQHCSQSAGRAGTRAPVGGHGLVRGEQRPADGWHHTASEAVGLPWASQGDNGEHVARASAAGYHRPRRNVRWRLAAQSS